MLIDIGRDGARLNELDERDVERSRGTRSARGTDGRSGRLFGREDYLPRGDVIAGCDEERLRRVEVGDCNFGAHVALASGESGALYLCERSAQGDQALRREEPRAGNLAPAPTQGVGVEGQNLSIPAKAGVIEPRRAERADLRDPAVGVVGRVVPVARREERDPAAVDLAPDPFGRGAAADKPRRCFRSLDSEVREHRDRLSGGVELLR